MDYSFTFDDDKEKLEETFTQWLKTSRTYHDELERRQKVASEYYKGNQTELESLDQHEDKTVENRIFEGIETIVPIATANPHKFLVLPGSDDETAKQRATNLQKVLSRLYETLNIQERLEFATRAMLKQRLGVLKVVWSEDKDDVDVIEIDSKRVYVPKVRAKPDDLPYVIEEQDYSKKEMEDYFPDVDLDELAYTNVEGRNEYKVYEVWTNELVAWFNNGKLLEKKASPMFDFEGEEEEYRTVKGKKKTKLRFYNHLDRPTKPYVFFVLFGNAEEPFGPVSLVDIAIPLQDAINTQKRQIIDNLKTMGNGQVYIDSEAMSQEESENITSEPGLVIRGEGVASRGAIKREPGVQLPTAHFANLTHTEQVFDNIMGVHASTRGAGEAKTLGQDMISRQQDYTRIDLVTRVLNRGVDRIANLLVQLMKMYYTEDHIVKVVGEKEASEFIRLNRSQIDDQIEIVVKSGETLPMDKVSLRTEAVQLWQLGAISPRLLYERLEIPHPEKAEQDLLAWKQGQLSMETQAKIQEMQAQAQFGAQAEAIKASAGGGAAQPSGRSVETPGNVLQRAQANLGGTANLTATPKQ